MTSRSVLWVQLRPQTRRRILNQERLAWASLFGELAAQRQDEIDQGAVG